MTAEFDRPPFPWDPAEPGAERLAAVCDLIIPQAREWSGVHRYDGVMPDLSPSGISAALDRLGTGSAPTDPHDAAHLGAVEDGLRWHFGELGAHRRDPLVHIEALDLACYDREYGPAAERALARTRHLAAWPDAVAAALESLDAVPAPVAEALLPSARGLGAALDEPGPDGAADDDALVAAARAALDRLLARLEDLAVSGSPEVAIGEAALAREMGVWEAVDVDVDDLTRTADAERDRLQAMLAAACRRLDRGRRVADLVPALLRDHPDADGVLEQARLQTAEVLAFTAEHSLAPWVDGECLVGPAPPSRRWAMAMMTWSAPGEPDAPSWYHVTPPEPDWPAEEIEEWLAVFSATTLPAITVHEVAPGHYAHARALRRAGSAVRRTLIMPTFTEGWAHYVEEAVAEIGFRAGDPRYLIGMCLEALVRVTRLACAIGLHTGEATVSQAAQRFADDAFLGAAAARSEARRGTFDVGYGRYTWGKLALLEAREHARHRWGAHFSLPRFHAALLDLGAPPLGLLDTALERG